MQPWLLVVLIGAVLQAFLNILIKNNNEKRGGDPKLYAVSFYLFSGIFILFWGILKGSLSYVEMDHYIFNILVAISLNGFGITLIFKSLKEIQASLFSIIYASSMFFTVFASSVFLKESLTTWQLVGAVLIFVSIVFVNKNSFLKFNFSKGEIQAFFAAFFMGIAATNSSFLLKNHLNITSYSLISFLGPAIFILIAYPELIKKLKFLFNPRALKDILIITIVHVVMLISYYYAFSVGNSSRVAAVAGSSVIFGVIIAMIFLKERDNFFIKIAAALVSFLGLFLISI